MGKKHASQYANFGWLRYYQVYISITLLIVTIKLTFLSIIWIFITIKNLCWIFFPALF